MDKNQVLGKKRREGDGATVEAMSLGVLLRLSSERRPALPANNVQQVYLAVAATDLKLKGKPDRTSFESGRRQEWGR